jgi:H+/Cl- antiporter ClcA
LSELIGSGARSFYGGIFTAVVRAPVTGIILVMMGSFALFLPMLRRHLVPTLLRNPTYDLLRSK